MNTRKIYHPPVSYHLNTTRKVFIHSITSIQQHGIHLPLYKLTWMNIKTCMSVDLKKWSFNFQWKSSLFYICTLIMARIARHFLIKLKE